MAGTLYEELGFYGQDVVDLSIASPDSIILRGCKDAMELGTMHCLATQEPGTVFQYGTRRGNLELRQTLASFLTENYDHEVSSDHLFITSGSTQGLVLLCNALFQSGDFVFVEDPTSSTALEIFSELGLKIVSVPADHNGLIVEELDKLLKAHSYRKRSATEKRPFWGFVYMMTNFQNPTGHCLSEERCSTLIDILQKHKVLCVCDDTLTCLSYAESHPPFKPAPKRLFGYDPSAKSDEEHGNVVSMGSFSTIFSPGLRLGWLEAPPNVLNLLKNSALVRSVGTSQQYLGGVVSSAIELGELTRHLSFLKITYHGRLNRLFDALTQHLPKTVKFSKPQGGLFVWLTLPDKVDVKELLKVCREKYKVGFSPGSKFSVTPDKFKNCVRLSIAHYNEKILMSSVENLATALKELM